jgi:hypothetical protein
MDIAQFRTDFPEFSNTTRFPTSLITFWSNLAEKLVSKPRWDTCYGEGVALFTAHNVALASIDAAAAANGKTPGVATGVVQSKSLGSAAISYDTQGSMQADAGHWNQTTYGRRYAWLAKMFGAGPVQL